MPFPQRLPIVNGDDGQWGDIILQWLKKEHYDDGTDNAVNGGHKTITVRAGTATAGTAPLKLTSGTLMSSPEAGAMEFLSDTLYFTVTTGAVRKTIAIYDDSSGATGDIYYRNSSGIFTRLGIGSTDNVLKVASGLPSWGSIPHSTLSSLTSGDDHTQYALLAGRSGGQILIGGTASGNNLTFKSSSHATAGKVIFGNAATTAYDEVNERFGVGTGSPGSVLNAVGSQPAAVSSATGTAASDNFVISGGTGGNTTIATTGTGGHGADSTLSTGAGGVASAAATSTTGGRGGDFSINPGDGGVASVTNSTLVGGVGGGFTVTAGTGGVATLSGTASATGGNGGALTLNAGTGGATSWSVPNNGGTGGAVSITSGTGGAAAIGTSNGGDGGNITLTAGIGGTGANSAGTAGRIFLQTGTSTTAATTKLTIGTTGITVADTINLVFSTSTGTKIGTGTGQKIGFYNATPVSQRAAITAAPAGGTGTAAGGWDTAAHRNTAITAINAIITALQDLGLTA